MAASIALIRGFNPSRSGPRGFGNPFRTSYQARRRICGTLNAIATAGERGLGPSQGARRKSEAEDRAHRTRQRAAAFCRWRHRHAGRPAPGLVAMVQRYILTGLCGAALMGGAVFASLDGETNSAAAPERVETALRGAARRRRLALERRGQDRSPSRRSASPVLRGRRCGFRAAPGCASAKWCGRVLMCDSPVISR